MTTTYTNLALVEGEVYVLLNDEIKVNDNFYDSLFKSIHYCDKIGVMGIIYDNKASVCFGGESELSRIKKAVKLDRKHFVKPKVDVEELAEGILLNEYWRDKPTSKQKLSEFNFDKRIFAAGYNAKEAEFTREDMEKAFRSGIDSVVIPGRTEKLFDEFINELHPLSLPASVTLNENNEVIAVEF